MREVARSKVAGSKASRRNVQQTGVHLDTVALRALTKCLRMRDDFFFFDGPSYLVTKWIARRISTPMKVAVSDMQLLPAGHTCLRYYARLCYVTVSVLEHDLSR
jgi:hypothetical protein